MALKKSVCSHVKDGFEEEGRLDGVLQYVQVMVRKILEEKCQGMELYVSRRRNEGWQEVAHGEIRWMLTWRRIQIKTSSRYLDKRVCSSMERSG